MATRNIVPRANEEGNIGTTLKNWLKGWFKDIFVSNNITDGTNSVTVSDITTHVGDTSNPHNVTKTQVGLGNVPNLDTTDAVNKAHDQNTDSGTTSTTFHLDSDSSGPKLKNLSGAIEIRNSADSAYANVKAQDVVINNEIGDGTNKTDPINLLTGAIIVELSEPSAGSQFDVQIPFDCVIVSCRMLADQTGSVVVDIWKDSYANFPPTDADSITASAVPTISSGIKSEDTSLTGWTTSITSGDILRFNVDSITSITRLCLTLTVRKV